DRWGDTKLKKYSKGMQQRIGIAQALVSDPDILLLDEPTDGVDPVGKVEIREVLRTIRAEGKSIVLNSHLLSEVESVADRVAILNRGRLVKTATVEELTSRRSQFEIEAAIGNLLFSLPEGMGKIIKLSARGMIVELESEEDINWVIDELRIKKIPIRMIRPMRITLEQSFIETITTPEPPSTEAGI
ncbi:MAG: ATP-binding cassette domain-containing protein, partial [candidate division Zixibacteria bacterium]|nr:ATP-binding cassette domain-containing protein [candidate division Zixibacteria bacterium]